jgi:hypothetical protein
MGLGWRNHDGFHSMEKTRMLVASQDAYQDLRKNDAISTSTKLYGVCRIPLKFEVERETLQINVLMDDNMGTVLQVVLKESKRDEDVTDHVIKVVRVSSKKTSSGPFITGIPSTVQAHQYCTQSTAHGSRAASTATSPTGGSTNVPMHFGISSSTGMYYDNRKEG